MNLKNLKPYPKCRFSVLGGRGDPHPLEQALKCDMAIYEIKNQVDTYHDQK